MSEHRNDTRFKWYVIAITFLVALIMILGTITELSR